MNIIGFISKENLRLVKRYIFFCLSIVLWLTNPLQALSISHTNAIKIADRIWQNEGNGKIENLTCWNQGEEFASLGIGHFIWYPKDSDEKFQQTFPALLLFLQNQNIDLPLWLKEAKGCPWNSREAFYQNFNSNQMQELRQLLFKTRGLQAFFMAKRLEQSIPNLLKTLNPQKQREITELFYRLISDPQGMYALVDYLNFKGAGISPTEIYKGEGWGLLQVLEKIDLSNPLPIQAFVQAAKEVLTRRVQNSPPQRNEQRWLKGWINRVNSYSNNKY